MIVLGIDPGSRITGYAFLAFEKKIKVLEYGTIQAKTKLELMDRIGKITDDLDLLIKEYHPGTMVMESAFFSKYPRSALVLGHIRGAIMTLAHRNQCSFSEFSPREVKQAAVGLGSATKEQVALMMQRNLSLKETPAPVDASDALAVAWTWFCRENIA